MAQQELSRQYAEAVYEEALQSWLDALSKVETNLAKDKKVAESLSGKGSFEQKQKALNKVIPDSVGQPVRNFLYTMLKDDNIGLLADVVEQLGYLARGGPQVQVAVITTAVPLEEAQKQQFRQKLAEKHGDNLEFKFEVDPKIIGGAKVRVGDEIIDGTVATRLAAMSNVLGVKGQ